MFSFLKKKKTEAKLATVLSKHANTSITSHSGKHESTELYFIEIQHPNGATEEFGVDYRLYRKANRGSRVRLYFDDYILDHIVIGT
ncbi:hypothetical protein SANA_10610 [Gottschalkiaceae bacterium SANA]|nr:hypothetical protein SANA_10610 [Gottschalkiaceae bacterium SANA]